MSRNITITSQFWCLIWLTLPYVHTQCLSHTKLRLPQRYAKSMFKIALHNSHQFTILIICNILQKDITKKTLGYPHYIPSLACPSCNFITGWSTNILIIFPLSQWHHHFDSQVPANYGCIPSSIYIYIYILIHIYIYTYIYMYPSKYHSKITIIYRLIKITRR